MKGLKPVTNSEPTERTKSTNTTTAITIALFFVYGWTKTLSCKTCPLGAIVMNEKSNAKARTTQT